MLKHPWAAGLAAIALLGALSLRATPPALAATTSIASCTAAPFVITASGSYQVTADLVPSGTDCIQIKANNVDLNLYNHTISGDFSDRSGVHIFPGFSGAHVHNLTAVSPSQNITSFVWGIVDQGAGALIENVTANGNDVGINLAGATAGQGPNGVLTNTIVQNNITNGNFRTGIVLGAGFFVQEVDMNAPTSGGAAPHGPLKAKSSKTKPANAPILGAPGSGHSFGTTNAAVGPNNQSLFNDLDGILITNGSSHNQVLANQADNNDFVGILLAFDDSEPFLDTTPGGGTCSTGSSGVASGNTVNSNHASFNESFGIALECGGALGNNIGNRNGGNTASGNLAFDGYDGNANCDNNRWVGNHFTTIFQPCDH
jgi:hypothetical protein